MNENNAYTVAQVAKAMGCSPQLVHRYVKQGRLQTIGPGKRLITIDALSLFLKLPRKVGRPKLNYDPLDNR